MSSALNYLRTNPSLPRAHANFPKSRAAPACVWWFAWSQASAAAIPIAPETAKPIAMPTAIVPTLGPGREARDQRGPLRWRRRRAGHNRSEPLSTNAATCSQGFAGGAIPAHDLVLAPEVGVRRHEDMHQPRERRDRDQRISHHDVEFHDQWHHRDKAQIRVEPDERPEIRRHRRREPRRTPRMEDGRS